MAEVAPYWTARIVTSWVLSPNSPVAVSTNIGRKPPNDPARSGRAVREASPTPARRGSRRWAPGPNRPPPGRRHRPRRSVPTPGSASTGTAGTRRRRTKHRGHGVEHDAGKRRLQGLAEGDLDRRPAGERRARGGDDDFRSYRVDSAAIMNCTFSPGSTASWATNATTTIRRRRRHTRSSSWFRACDDRGSGRRARRIACGAS